MILGIGHSDPCGSLPSPDVLWFCVMPSINRTKEQVETKIVMTFARYSNIPKWCSQNMTTVREVRLRATVEMEIIRKIPFFDSQYCVWQACHLLTNNYVTFLKGSLSSVTIVPTAHNTIHRPFKISLITSHLVNFLCFPTKDSFSFILPLRSCWGLVERWTQECCHMGRAEKDKLFPVPAAAVARAGCPCQPALIIS